MANGGEYHEGASHEWLDDLDRVRTEIYLELGEQNLPDQVIDSSPRGVHERCVRYIRAKYDSLQQNPPSELQSPEIMDDERREANLALTSASMYRLEMDFQDSLIEDAVTTRRIMEKIAGQLEAGEEVDREFFWASAINKKHHQVLFDVFYGRDLSEPWQKFYHAVTEQFSAVDYSTPEDVALYVNTESAYWQFEEVCAAHNMILREAAERAGLFKIKDDPEMILRLVTILVETQLIAMRDRELGFWTDRIVEYGKQWGVGDRLIETLSTLYRERYLQD